MVDDTTGSGRQRDHDPDSTPVERALDAHLHGDTPDTDLAPDDQSFVDDLLPWLDALHTAAAEAAAEQSSPSSLPCAREPVGPDDPVALMLGLVSDPDTVVEGRKLARARQQAGLDLGKLVDRLRHRGWDFTTREGLRWELGQTALPPALVTTIASELAVSDTALLSTPREGSTLHDLFDDARVSAFLADWAAEIGLEAGVLRQRASSTLAGAAHRNRTAGSVDALLDVLRTLRAIPDFLDKP